MLQRLLLPALAIILLCLSEARMVAQSAPCTLKLADLPTATELKGFHLGMTQDQVKARVPQVLFAHDNEVGVTKTTINPDFDPRINKVSFSGVRSISLDFLDSRLISLWFGYDGTFKWKSVSEFVEGISDKLNLPNAWESWRIRGQQLRCADFSMTVSIVAEGISFRIVDESAAEVIAQRRQAKEEEQSAEADQAETDPEPVVGDSRTKTYFTMRCPPDKPIESKDQIQFQSAEQAEKAGYKRAKSCQQ
jgi:hypothetical protein